MLSETNSNNIKYIFTTVTSSVKIYSERLVLLLQDGLAQHRSTMVSQWSYLQKPEIRALCGGRELN